jgi:hypothetical protein
MELMPLPLAATLQDHHRQAEALLHAHSAARADAITFFLNYHPGLNGHSPSQVKAAQLTVADAQQALANWHHFEDWPALEQWTAALHADHSPVLRFESAVEAVINGDTHTLQSLLQEYPALIHARSTRKHHAMLLHYTGTNGVEDYRQRYPSNALAVLQLLLAAGADVNARADMYGGGCTTLVLTATSVHPVNAGIMISLLETLLAARACIDTPEALARGAYTVNSCLHNGRHESAAFLARQGARLDLEGAAGIGRLDIVRSAFNKNGSLKNGITKTKLEYGFAWACEYGHNDVVDFLLQKGMDINQLVEGLPGLHWAIIAGRPDTVELLISRKASLEIQNIYEGSALEAALWALVNCWPASNDYDIRIITILVNAGAHIHPDILPWLAAQTRIPEAKKSVLNKLLHH